MPSLFLYPVDPQWRPASLAAFAGGLEAFGLITSAAQSGSGHDYRAGKDFLKLVMFLGCSPRVLLDPSDVGQGEALCAVRLASFDEPALLASDPLPAVRCPTCRAKVQLPADPAPAQYYRCRQCGNASTLARLDWRQGAGYGRFFLELSGIYPHEAVPSDRLLAELQAISQCEWACFYADHRSCRRWQG